jgi:hypothetical protein
VGNPPFAGKNTLINGNREGYLDWLKTIHEESHGNADLVAHFFRRAFNLVRPRGCFGLIATNTIGQGDTRSTGLRWICTHGGTIYAARKRLKWPGQAAVVVSVVHVCRGETAGPFVLDGREAPIITAYLFHAGGHDDPERLNVNEGKSFQGSIVLGMGFTFDDTDTSGVANPLSLMKVLIGKDSRNAERIFPYIGGEEVNDNAVQGHHRHVINFGEMSEEEAQRWPDLFQIVEGKVKPERLMQKDRGAKMKWWQFIRPRPELAAAMAGMRSVLVVPRTSKHLAFVMLPGRMVFSENLVVFPFDDTGVFCSLQSNAHAAWVAFFSSTLEDRQGYRPSDCFDTFPCPQGVLGREANSRDTSDPGPLITLESAGREYYEFRAALMVRNNEGLTKTYNRFHDPHETSPDILQLRELHAAMDRTVLEAYGWHDLAETAICEFLLDYEDEEDDEPLTTDHGPRTSRRKKPWRCRWPDEFRDEVLARLLALNKERAEQERLAGQLSVDSGPLSEKKGKRAAGKPKPKKPPKPQGPSLPGF